MEENGVIHANQVEWQFMQIWGVRPSSLLSRPDVFNNSINTQKKTKKTCECSLAPIERDRACKFFALFQRIEFEFVARKPTVNTEERTNNQMASKSKYYDVEDIISEESEIPVLFSSQQAAESLGLLSSRRTLPLWLADYLHYYRNSTTLFNVVSPISGHQKKMLASASFESVPHYYKYAVKTARMSGDSSVGEYLTDLFGKRTTRVFSEARAIAQQDTDPLCAQPSAVEGSARGQPTDRSTAVQTLAVPEQRLFNAVYNTHREFEMWRSHELDTIRRSHLARPCIARKRTHDQISSGPV